MAHSYIIFIFFKKKNLLKVLIFQVLMRYIKLPVGRDSMYWIDLDIIYSIYS
jgi:hypothetical protein